MLEGVEDVHGAVLGAVFVPRDHAAADPAVVGVLAPVVQLGRVAVEALDDPGAHRALLPEPDGRADEQDVGIHHALEQVGPPVGLEPVLAHVGVDARRQVVVHGAHDLDGDAVALHDPDGPVEQALRV